MVGKIGVPIGTEEGEVNIEVEVEEVEPSEDEGVEE